MPGFGVVLSDAERELRVRRDRRTTLARAHRADAEQRPAAYFRHDGELRNTVGRIGEKIDPRGEGG
jgi:hypothetical protein